jgi:hypothetical protein
MQPVAIYMAVVDDLDRPVSKSTIKNELRRRLAIEPMELWQTETGAYTLGTWAGSCRGLPRDLARSCSPRMAELSWTAMTELGSATPCR